MKIAFFLLFLTFAGSRGSLDFRHCDIIDKCEHLYLNMLDDIHGPPDSDQLKEFCKPALNVFECLSNQLKNCTGKDLEELVASDNDTIASLTELASYSKELIGKVCNGDSKFHKDFASAVSCLGKELTKGIVRPCSYEGMKLYKEYVISMNKTDEELDEEVIERQSQCMTSAYEIACTEPKLQRACGALTTDIFLDVMVRRVKVLSSHLCNPTEYMTLKTKYMDFLEKQGKQRSVYARILNLE